VFAQRPNFIGSGLYRVEIAALFAFEPDEVSNPVDALCQRLQILQSHGVAIQAIKNMAHIAMPPITSSIFIILTTCVFELLSFFV